MNNFYIVLTAAFFILLIISLLVQQLALKEVYWSETISSAAVSFVLFSAGYFLTAKSLQSSGKTFLSVLMGSMVIRIFLVLSFILIGIVLFEFDEYLFVFNLFFFYLTFLVLELIFVQRLSKERKLS